MAISARYVGSLTGDDAPILKTYAVASGVTVSDGDFVYLSSGRITNATITGSPRLIGVAQGVAVTGNAGGTNTMLVNVNHESLYLVQNNAGGTFDATSVGKYFALTGATGAQQVATATAYANSGVVLCLEVNTGQLSTDATYGVFKIVNHAFLPYVANV